MKGAARLRDAAQIVEGIDSNLPSARGALVHAVAIVDAARRDLQRALDVLVGDVPAQPQGGTVGVYIGPPRTLSADELRGLNAAISASTAGLGSASNPHPRRSV